MAPTINYKIKVGDLLPILSATLEDQAGNPANLTGFTAIQLRFKRRGAAETPTTVTGTIVDALAGTVSYTWVSPNTDVAGIYDAEWIGTAAGGEPQTWPTDGYFQFEIEAPLS